MSGCSALLPMARHSACKTPSNPWSRRSLPGEAKSTSRTTYRFWPSQSRKATDSKET